MKRTYPTDLSDAEWGCIEPYAPPPSRRGRPKTHATRQILDAVFYVLKSGCPWRLLPRGFPPWETVHRWFGRWRTDGTFQRLNAALRERVRARLGRNQHPSAGVADSQSAKTTGVGGEQRGYDGNKKVRGRKRHLLVVLATILLALGTPAVMSEAFWWVVFCGVIVACGLATPVALRLWRSGVEGLRASEPAVAGRDEGRAQRELLEAIDRHRGITPARAALETTLTVAEADRMLSDLAKGGYLEVRVEGGKLLYGL